ncbi:oxidoreductase [Kibdelosporangium lantanae]
MVAAVRRPGNDEILLDVTDPGHITAAVDEVLRRHGRIDVLVNNAGRGLIGAAEEIADTDLRDLMDLHFFGPAALTRAVLPHMRERGSGVVVQMSSQAGRYSFPGVGAYSATKFALEGWSEALAAEVEPFGVHVVIVEPGPFRTSFNEPGVLRFAEDSQRFVNVSAVREALAGADGRQAGDPVRAARAIVTAVDSAKPPLRLALGNEAVDSIAASLDRARAELAEWAELARAADFPA